MSDDARHRGRAQDRHGRLRGRGGVPRLHGGRAELVAGRHPLDPRRRREGDRLRGARGRRGLRGLRERREGPLGDRRLLGAAEPARARLEHPRAASPSPTEVEVRFLPEGDATRVELEHRGWEAVAEDAERSGRGTTPAGTTSSACTSGAWLAGELTQRAEPAQPLVPGDGRVRRRGRREDEERRLAEPPLLEPVLARSPKTPVYAALPTNAMTSGRIVRAISSSRSAAPAKSALRRSPEPRVVRPAAFVSPRPSGSSSAASSGSSRRGVKPAACSSRQKSFRGFANGAFARALQCPGLIPQKTMRDSGPR